MKLLYKPFAVIAGIVAGKAAGKIFDGLWRLLARETKAPLALEQNRGWIGVILASTLKGAVFGGVRAIVDRAFATGYFRRTGVWPGKIAKPQND
jgi:Protein of unknown function (DUF4235)